MHLAIAEHLFDVGDLRIGNRFGIERGPRARARAKNHIGEALRFRESDIVRRIRAENAEQRLPFGMATALLRFKNARRGGEGDGTN